VDTSANIKPIDTSFPAEIIDAFVAATATAFQELCGTEVSVHEASAEAQDLRFDVVANMFLRHDPPGQLTLAFPLSVLEKLTRRYSGDSVSLTPDLLDDAAGEFLNVIAGQAKTMLKESPAHYLLSIPSVHRPSGDRSSPLESNAIAWRFDCDCGSFVLKACLPR